MAEVPEDDVLAEDRGPDRRTVVHGAAVLGLAAAVGLPLAGCGGGSSQSAAGAPPVPVAPEPTATTVPRAKSQLYRRGEGDVAVTEPLPTRTAAPSARPSAEPGAVEAPAPSKADRLSTARGPGQAGPQTDGDLRRSRKLTVKTDDIPIGGGTVYPRHTMVVTQPEPGVYAAFDARCTHQGCLVADCDGGSIRCPCHESRYALEDGSVVQGPAKKPLARRRIVVTEGEIREK